MNSNSENPSVGKNFENLVKRWAESYFGQIFYEKSIGIGNPQTGHKFDLVSLDEKVIIECKCYTWTETGNVPSAKIATLDEAVLYLRSINYPAQKIIAMKHDCSIKNGKPLADYFNEKKGHLLEDISIIELDDNGKCRFVRDHLHHEE